MRFVLQEKRDPDAELIGVAVGGLATFVGFVWLQWLHLPLSSGLLHRVFDVPCPFCGGTRTATLLLGGQWMTALRTNPLVVFGAVVFALWMAYAAVVVVGRCKRIRIVGLSTLEICFARIGVFTLLLANWGYVWWAGV